jgi:hypothetical protein
MEARKVIIVNNKTQSQKTIMSNATTLGELKAEARAAGINIEDMTWYEGHMRAELKDDAAPLPATVMWKGTETTDLTFLLTQPEKKVKSGAMSRAEAYAKIRVMDLGELCKEKYGKNFTQCSTNDLIALIEANETHQQAHECPRAKMFKEAAKETSKGNLEGAFEALVKELYDDDYLDEEQYSRIMAIFKGEKYEAPEKMSQKEIDEMFSFVK